MSAGLRRRSVLGDPTGRSGPMMTPMVDVVLVILIFFMASTTIAGYEWFLHAAVESEESTNGTQEQARFALPAAIIDVDLVHTSDGATMVYGISGNAGVSIDQAAAMIDAMDLEDSGSLRVGLGARDGVPMRDVMRIHDAWHGRSVKVVMKVGG